MALLGVGVDLIEIERVRRTIERTPGVLARLFTDAEVARCTQRGGQLRVAGLAARLCAKEALAKALGTGLRGFGWRDLEVVNDALGKPSLLLSGAAAAQARRGGVEAVHLSLSTSDTMAIAQVVLEGRPPSTPAAPAPRAIRSWERRT